MAESVIKIDLSTLPPAEAACVLRAINEVREKLAADGHRTYVKKVIPAEIKFPLRLALQQ
jgi:hypothetical protein